MEYQDFKRKDGQQLLRLQKYAQPKGAELPLLEYPLLERTGIVRHGFSTREGGVSGGEFAALNFSFTRGDDPLAVEENYRRIAAVFGCMPDDIVCSDQTHTTNVRRVGRAEGGAGVTKERPYADVDGLITNEPGILLATFYADCVPLFLVDPVHRAIGLSHSGWRGTVGRMGAVTLRAMNREFGTMPHDVYAAVGPSICGDCYEIGGDVAAEFERAFPEWRTDILRAKSGEKYQLDLWRCNERILLEAGVPGEQIAVTNICTCCNPNLLFSHRASHGRRGNLGAFLMLA